MMTEIKDKPKEMTEDEKFYQNLRAFEPPPGWVGGFMNLTSEMVIAAIEKQYGAKVVGVSKSQTLAMALYTENGIK